LTSRVGWVPLIAALLVTWLWAPSAEAYPWMIRHGYTGCATCHSDPSGGSLLTPYGRAQSELLLSTRWGSEQTEEPSKFSQQLLGMPLPDAVLAGVDLRDAYMWNLANGEVVDHRALVMRTDAMAQVRLSRLRLYGSLGYARTASALQTQQAWVSRDASWGNVVSREHWVGLDVTDHVLVRAGRLMLPFGVRTIDHTLWVRSETQTDINQEQQHGVSASYDGGKLRAEGMAILGNYQISPDAYRERGFAGYVDFYPKGTWSLGGSAKATHAATDLLLRRATTRQAYGLMGRYRPLEALVLTGELDGLLTNVDGGGNDVGHASMLQADLQLLPGVHLVGVGETTSPGDGSGTAFGGWFSAWWFPIAHTDVRLDVISRTLPGTSASVQTILLQGHIYL
jgi:hypothetical protein